MKKILAFTIWLFAVSLWSAPAPVLRNFYTTNANPGVSIATNAAVAHGQTWHFTNTFISESRVASSQPVPIKWWGTWNDYGAGVANYVTNVSETNILLQCHWMKTNGLWDAGYRYISIQEGWQGPLNPDGTFSVTNRFPQGMKWLCNEIRKLGFKPGIYTGINANEPANTCMGYPGTSYTNLLTHMRQFADWGIEFVFFDSCQGYGKWTQAPEGVVTAEAWDEVSLFRERGRLIQNAIEAANFTNRPVVLLSPPFTLSTNIYGSRFPDQRGTHTANIWPIAPTNTWDFIAGGFSEIPQYFATNIFPAQRLFGPGFFPYGHIIPYWITATEQKLVVALDAILPATTSFVSSPQRINFWANPGLYPPSTWNDIFLDASALTNIPANQIQMDPAGIPGRQVYSNDSCMVFVRRLGSEYSRSNALLIVNWKNASQTVQVPHAWMGVPDSIPLTYQEIYFNTNAANFVTSNASFTVGSSNLLFAAVFPSTAYFETESAEEFDSNGLTGTGASVTTATGYGPANWYNRNGLVQSAANQQMNYYCPIPDWATGVEFSCDMTTAGSGTIAWTMNPGYEMYGPTTRETFYYLNTASITQTVFTCTSAALTRYTTGFPLTPTNAPRMLNIGWLDSTNAAARYVVGPYRVKFTRGENR